MLSKITKDDLSKIPAGSPDTSQRDATDDEKENEYYFTVNQSLTDEQVKALFPYYALHKVKWFIEAEKDGAYTNIRTCCEKLHLHALDDYTYVKGRKATTYRATPEFPLFLIDEVKYKIIYAPMHPEPDCRYTYCNDVPESFLHGLKQAEKEIVRRDKKKEENKIVLEGNPEAEFDYEDLGPLSEIILVRLPESAFGLALMGYFPCYLTGTRPELSGYDFITLSDFKLCKKVYQLRDNCDAGHKHAHRVALEHLDIFNIELPVTVQVSPDPDFPVYRRIMCLNDFFTHKKKYDFGKLLEDALPYRFWDKEPEYGGPKDKRVRVGWKYDFRSTYSYNFLNKMGFYRLPIEGRKSNYIFIHVDGNIVREREPVDVKNFIHRFLKERRVDTVLRDTLYESTRLNESSLSNLDEIDIDFTDNDEKTQFLFFKNATLEVTAEKITQHPAGEIKRFVWEKDVITHQIEWLDASPFTITAGPDGIYDIVVNHNDCLFFNFMIQTSRIHWRRELEVLQKDKSETDRKQYLADHKFDIAGPDLIDEERFEQKQHLINKIFALGHVLHQYKSRSKSWAVVGMDNKISKDGKSHGGSGKSLLFNQTLGYIYPSSIHAIPGTNPKITENPHIFHGLTKDKKALIIDDADKALNFRFFFEYINGNQVINNKNGDIFTLKFKDVPKMVWLTNFAFTADTSTERRILYIVASDYYHEKTENNDYRETRAPKDDFDKDLFTHFDEAEFNSFYNTIAYCIQFYMRCNRKLNPPMSSVNKRAWLREMGVEFEAWASMYFHSMGDNRNRLIVKDEAKQEFMKKMGKNYTVSSTQFKRQLEAYCKYNGYGFNPEELITDKEGNRILGYVSKRTMDRNDEWISASKKETQELIYIQTDFDMELNRTLPGAEPHTAVEYLKTAVPNKPSDEKLF